VKFPERSVDPRQEAERLLRQAGRMAAEEGDPGTAGIGWAILALVDALSSEVHVAEVEDR